MFKESYAIGLKKLKKAEYTSDLATTDPEESKKARKLLKKKVINDEGFNDYPAFPVEESSKYRFLLDVKYYF